MNTDSVTEQKTPYKAIRYNLTSYTLEQKIVAAVWYHEKVYTGMSYDQLKQNFLIRFKMQYPKHSTVKRWECQLFRDGNLLNKPIATRCRTMSRLIHVPYVKESLIRYPDLSLSARANLLGMPKNTLGLILRKDLKKEDFNNFEKSNDSNESDAYEQTKMCNDLNRKGNDVHINEAYDQIEIKTETVEIKYDEDK